MKKGFTLIEILLVVAALAILATIVIIAINPTKQLGDTRNAARRADVETILNAIYQYAIDNNGSLPVEITASEKYICKTGETCGASYVDLSVLTDSKKYLVKLPVDPSIASSTTNIGYTVYKDNYNRVTVTAPNAEQDATIDVSR